MFRTILPLMLLAACGGGNYCERSAKLAEDCGQTLSDEDMATCEEMVDNCSGEDQDLLNESLDCIEENELFVCDTTGGDVTTPTGTGTMTGMDDLMAILACYAPLANLSEECASGMGMSGTMTMTMSR